MKKIIALMLFLMFPFIVNAKEEYEITDYYISSEVEIAGGIKVKELIVLEGTFEGFEREIIYKNSKLKDWEERKINFEESSFYNATGIDKLKVATFKVKGSVDFETMEKVDSFATEAKEETLGEKNVYTTKEINDGLKVNIYMPSKEEKIAFYLEYVVTNAVVMHEDVAELYYHYLPKTFSESINNFALRVFIPSPDTSEKFNVWAHGPATGELNKYTNENGEAIGVLATSKNLLANTGFDIRMTFDKSILMINNFVNHSKQKALPSIIEVENERYKKSLDRQEKGELANNLVIYMAIGYLIILVLSWIFIYVKRVKNNLLENKIHIKIFGVLLFIVSLVIFAINILLKTQFVLGYLIIIPAVLFMIYTCRLK